MACKYFCLIKNTIRIAARYSIKQKNLSIVIKRVQSVKKLNLTYKHNHCMKILGFRLSTKLIFLEGLTSQPLRNTSYRLNEKEFSSSFYSKEHYIFSVKAILSVPNRIFIYMPWITILIREMTSITESTQRISIS